MSKGINPKEQPPLGERWEHDGQTFGDFLGASFRRYYAWTVNAQSEPVEAAQGA